jgi:hypothetical protein
LADVLGWVTTPGNVTDPIGRLYIVTHAHEDGTLSFGLNAGDTDRRLSIGELRNALRSPGALPRVGNQVDAQTRIHIKGCDLGRTPAMVELIDEAFGGAGTVTAPTHEQHYYFDRVLADRARAAAHSRFRGEAEAAHPLPPPVDPNLRGRERTRAERRRREELVRRRRVIDAEVRARRADEQRSAAWAGYYESFRGPMFQRPGTRLFQAAELAPEIDRLYPHLSDAQRRALAQGLVRRDPRRGEHLSTIGQHGQRVDRHRFSGLRFEEPRTVAEAVRLYGRDFRQNHFAPSAVRATRERTAGGFRITVEVDGTVTEPGQVSRRDTRTYPSSGAVSDDMAMIRAERELLPNPSRYAWRVEERHTGDGYTTRAVVAERVMAYLHHESLDPSAHEHFTRPLTDPNFFVTSTFAPTRQAPRGPRRP